MRIPAIAMAIAAICSIIPVGTANASTDCLTNPSAFVRVWYMSVSPTANYEYPGYTSNIGLYAPDSSGSGKAYEADGTRSWYGRWRLDRGVVFIYSDNASSYYSYAYSINIDCTSQSRASRISGVLQSKIDGKYFERDFTASV